MRCKTVKPAFYWRWTEISVKDKHHLQIKWFSASRKREPWNFLHVLSVTFARRAPSLQDSPATCLLTWRTTRDRQQIEPRRLAAQVPVVFYSTRGNTWKRESRANSLIRVPVLRRDRASCSLVGLAVSLNASMCLVCPSAVHTPWSEPDPESVMSFRLGLQTTRSLCFDVENEHTSVWQWGGRSYQRRWTLGSAHMFHTNWSCVSWAASVLIGSCLLVCLWQIALKCSHIDSASVGWTGPCDAELLGMPQSRNGTVLLHSCIPNRQHPERAGNFMFLQAQNLKSSGLSNWINMFHGVPFLNTYTGWTNGSTRAKHCTADNVHASCPYRPVMAINNSFLNVLILLLNHVPFSLEWTSCLAEVSRLMLFNTDWSIYGHDKW